MVNLSDFLKDPYCIYYVVYQVLILLALILSFVSYKRGRTKLYFLIWVLFATFLVELLADILKGFIWIYHIFNWLEYALFSMYYIKNCNVNKYKNWILASIPVFIIFSFCISLFLYGFKSLPAININVEGLLLFIMYTHLLFSLDIDINISIYNYPDFWLTTGLLIYFGGVFVYFNLYRNLLHLNHNQTIHLYELISLPLNVILYGCIVIGQICLMRNKKYITL